MPGVLILRTVSPFVGTYTTGTFTVPISSVSFAFAPSSATGSTVISGFSPASHSVRSMSSTFCQSAFCPRNSMNRFIRLIYWSLFMIRLCSVFRSASVSCLVLSRSHTFCAASLISAARSRYTSPFSSVL